MNRRLTLIAAVGALGLAGCGSSSSSPTSTAAASVATTKTQTYTITATKTATAPARPAPAATSAGTGGQCVASDLALSSLGQQGGMGHGELGFSLRNTSSKPCLTGGFPGVQFTSSNGASLPTDPTHVTQDFFGTAPVTRITLAPGQSASFRIGTTHEAQGTATCTTAAGVQVIAPNDTATLRTTVANGAYECETVTVSPLRPGATAYQQG